MKKHTIRITAQCAHTGAHGRCRRLTTITHPFCHQHTQDVLGVRVAPSNIKGAGLGLFAMRPFSKDTQIVEYDGTRITTAVFDEMYAQDKAGAYGLALNSKVVIDASMTSAGVARYVCDFHGSGKKPNVEYIVYGKRVWVVACRDIKPTEELLVDYGPGMQEAMGIA